MHIRLGYVAISKTLDITTSHTLTYTNYVKIVNNSNKEKANQKLKEITNKNLDNLIKILDYNIKNNIHFYRLSSRLFPLATHKQVDYNFLSVFKPKLQKIGKIINDNKIRVDIHLDQFCVLNSIDPNIVESTINIIKFYKNMFNTMNIKSKMIIHIGSSKEGKEKSIQRFINNFNLLDEESKKLIIIENDDKIYNIKDIIKISNKLNIPIVLDYHHHICNNDSTIIQDYIEDIFNSWKEDIPKIHFSSPKNAKDKRAHNDYINSSDFIEFINEIKFINRNYDIMIEAKQKDFALFKLVRELKYKNIIFTDETTIKM